MPCDDKKPLVSVIMGVYNIENLTRFNDAVESVLSQTMHDFEFLICDDGSTDNTWSILEKISKNDSRIRLLRNLNNMGLAFSLNKCLKESRGIFIARQDADDISEDTRYQKQIDFLNHNDNISFVGSNVSLWDENGSWGQRRFPQLPQTKDFLFTQPFVHGALMFRKEALKQVNGYRVAKETRRTEDYDMLMRMYSKGLQGANLPEQLYYFREDRAAQNRRKYCYRIDEAKVRYHRFRELGLMPKALPYVIKPIIVGLIPQTLLRKLKNIRNF